jgi:DNA-binding CsgD family transcriptional regulator
MVRESLENNDTRDLSGLEALGEPINYVDEGAGVPASGDGAQALIYGEEDLAVTAAARPYPAPGILDELLSAGTAQQRQDLVRARLRRLGIDWFAYGTVRQDDGGADQLEFLSTYAHPGWLQRYLAGRCHEVDPRHHDAACHAVPLVWDSRTIWSRVQAQWAGERGYCFAEALGDSGLRSGIYFQLPVPALRGGLAVLSFASGTPHRHWVTEETLGAVQVFGLGMHEFLSRHVRRPGPTGRPSVSVLRQDILLCVRRGLTNKQVARQLGLSLYTVDYHLRHLRRRFGARNRTQLVLAAQASDRGPGPDAGVALVGTAEGDGP